jgi:hypothetical protein
VPNLRLAMTGWTRGAEGRLCRWSVRGPGPASLIGVVRPELQDHGRSVGPRRCGSLWPLVHPATTGAFALLAVNDHILKHRYPGVLTGKLSDFAGLAGVTLVLGAFMRNPPGVLLLVSAMFTALKVVPGVAEALGPVLGGVAVRDASDLVALVVVPVCAYWSAGSPAGPSLRSAAPGLGYAAMVAAILATTATSCEVPPQVDGFAQSDDGTVHAHIKDETYDDAGNALDASVWAVSNDGGATFRRASDPPGSDLSTAATACGERCYRLRHDAVEERVPGGAWRISFSFSRDERERIKLRSDQDCGWRTEQFTAVAVVQRPDGEHVLVAMGTQGVLHRAPAGEWERRAVLDRRPILLSGPSWLSKLALAPLIMPVLGLGLLVVGWRGHERNRGIAALVFCAAVGASIFTAAGVLIFFGVDYTIYGPAVAIVSIVIFAVSVAWAVTRGLPGAGRRHDHRLPSPPG